MDSIEKSCCFTGYRPEKFGFDFAEADESYCKMVRRLYTAIAEMLERGCTVFYTGMAKGFDILAAEQVLTLKKANKKIKLVAVLPFSGQEKGWSSHWQQRYNEILRECDEVKLLNEEYARWVYAQRNRYMVDRCRYVITYFDGKNGGTKSTIEYAQKHSREVLNIFETNPVEKENSRYSAQLYIIPPEE